MWKTRIAEPKQPGFSRWRGDDKARAAVYANRIRLGSGVGKKAMRLRAEIVERSFAHNLDRGGMRRTWLRGRENVHKRYLVHTAGHNLTAESRRACTSSAWRSYTRIRTLAPSTTSSACRAASVRLDRVSTNPSGDRCLIAFHRRLSPPYGRIIRSENVSRRTELLGPASMRSRHAIPLQNLQKGNTPDRTFCALAALVRLAGPLPGRAGSSAHAAVNAVGL